MNRLKKWLAEQYLPAYARQSMLEEQARLQRELAELQERHRTLRAYTEGLEHALAALRCQHIHVEIGGGTDGNYQGTV